MIVFDLECINGHVFEGWFGDRDDLNRQQEEGLLQCPVCDSFSVSTKLSAVAIRTSASPGSSPDREMADQAQMDFMADFTEKMTQYVENNYENVGSSFAKQALEMHYGAKEFKQIRGNTTKEEEKTLEKEGVPLLKLPTFKKDNEDLN